MGIVGKEKIEIYKKTKVGVVNPSGRTEVCPISALEMEAAGIPIVSKKINGLPDVVINDCTGILFTSEYQLTNAIVGLLQNQEMNNKFSKQARIYIKDNFNPKYICRKWYDLFEDVKNNGKVPVIRVSGNYSNNFKWLRIVNYKLKQHYIFKGLPSVIAIEGDVRKILLGKPHGK